jgi:hypothetical protein
MAGFALALQLGLRPVSCTLLCCVSPVHLLLQVCEEPNAISLASVDPGTLQVSGGPYLATCWPL